MADTATFSAAMKTKFIGPIRDSLHKGKVLLFGDAEANPEQFRGILPSAEGIDFVGNEFRIPLKAKRNQAVGFRSENEVLPAPGASEYTYLTEPMRYAYGLFNITGQLLKAAASDQGAFVRAFKQEMDDTVLTSKLDFNRAAYGDGSGKFATVRVDPGTAAIASTPLEVDSTINFRGGEVVDVVTTAGVVIEPALVVTAVSRSGRSVTFGGASGNWPAAVDTSSIVVRASSDSTVAVPNNSQNREIQGLQSLVSSTGTVHGVNPTTYPFWKSEQQAVSGPLNDTVLRTAKDNVGFESGADLESGLDFAIITTRGIRRRYADTLLANRQVSVANPVKLHGGFSALFFDENPIFVDDACPIGNVFGLALRDFFWSQLADWDWMDEDGNVLKWESRRDRYIAVLYKYCQLGITARNRHFRLTAVTDDTK
jgi:hypothetical protein